MLSYFPLNPSVSLGKAASDLKTDKPINAGVENTTTPLVEEAHKTRLKRYIHTVILYASDCRFDMRERERETRDPRWDWRKIANVGAGRRRLYRDQSEDSGRFTVLRVVNLVS